MLLKSTFASNHCINKTGAGVLRDAANHLVRVFRRVDAEIATRGLTFKLTRFTSHRSRVACHQTRFSLILVLTGNEILTNLRPL